MAKKITGYIKLQVPAGKANPAPPIGPALAQHGIGVSILLQSDSELNHERFDVVEV